MSRMKDLIGNKPYPYSPGSKIKGASAEAASAILPRAGTLQNLCLVEITRQSGTPDEIAYRIQRHILSVRPRITELIAMGLVRKTEQKRLNDSGQYANVVERVPEISTVRVR